MAEPKWKPRGEHTLLNHDVPRVDGPLKVTGVAKYSHEIRLPDMVWARVLIHPYPRLFVNEVDVKRALAIPGVVYAVSRKEPGTEVRYQGADGILAVVAAGLRVAGYTTQAEFLLATGLLEACQGVDPDSRRHAELTAQIKRLTLPGQMGEAVKVLALVRGYEDALRGFSARDLRGRL